MAADTVAVSCWLFTNVVASASLFQFTVAPEIKPVPLTVRVKAEPPGATLAGTSGCWINGADIGTPEPDMNTSCSPPMALSKKFSHALRVPTTLGLKVIVTVQAFVGAMTAPVQVLALLAKSLGFVPVIETLEMERLAVPVLVTVAVKAALVTPEGRLPKLKLPGDKLAIGSIPVPVRVTTAGVLKALSLRLSVALWLPIE